MQTFYLALIILVAPSMILSYRVHASLFDGLHIAPRSLISRREGGISDAYQDEVERRFPSPGGRERCSDAREQLAR